MALDPSVLFENRLSKRVKTNNRDALRCRQQQPCLKAMQL